MMLAFARHRDLNVDNENDFPSNANSFFESLKNSDALADDIRDVRVVDTVLDFANQPPFGSATGHFSNADPATCPNPDGCEFFPPACPPFPIGARNPWTPPDANDLCPDWADRPVISPDLSFPDSDWPEKYTNYGARLRGYLNVPPDWVGKHVYFGSVIGAGASIVLWDGNMVPHAVIIRHDVGATLWVSTNTVTFERAGIYPMEVIFHRALSLPAFFELAYFLGTDDSLRDEEQILGWPQPSLSEQGYQLFSPDMFFQTLTGTPSFPNNVDMCEQCPRSDVNIPGSDACDAGYYCNDAALCAPCQTARFCGPGCIPCGGTTEFCGDAGGDGVYECVECLVDEDCEEGFSCDPDTLSCNECNVNEDCPRGDECIDNACVPCGSSDSCSGNSCNCCPVGADGVQLACGELTPGADPVCLECTADADCATGLCDLTIGRCVESLYQNQQPDCCGPNCLTCPGDHPFCLPGPLGTSCAECRWDTDCAEGTFCQSGECQPCSEDRRCGERCLSCADDTPFCKEDRQTPANSTCVACIRDADCASGACDLATNTCAPAFDCGASCTEGTQCFGDSCVECFADVHCPCGGVCDRSTFTCLTSCRANDDCLGYEHCSPDIDTEEKSCKVGPSVVQSPCGALATSCISFACSVNVAPTIDERRPLGALLLGLVSLVILFRLRRRRGCP